MRALTSACLLIAASALAAPAHAQTYTNSPTMGDIDGRQGPWGIEMRVGRSATTQNFSGEDLDYGLGFEFRGTYRLSRVLGLYAGASIDLFDANKDFTGRDNALADLGYIAGLTVDGNFGASRVGWRLHGGANYGEIKVYEDDNDSNVGATGHKLGWELGAAITIALPNKWELSPGITYRSRSATLRLNGVDRDADLEYYRLGIGFGRRF